MKVANRQIHWILFGKELRFQKQFGLYPAGILDTICRLFPMLLPVKAIETVAVLVGCPMCQTFFRSGQCALKVQ